MAVVAIFGSEGTYETIHLETSSRDNLQSARNRSKTGPTGLTPMRRLLILVMACNLTAEAASGPPTKAAPEIDALLPRGQYVGSAHKGRALDVSLHVQESRPGGRFTGTVVVRQAAAPCDAVFPLSGEIKPDGAVQIDSREGVVPGCERHFDLKLATNELTGTMTEKGDKLPVKLKRLE